MRKEKSGGAAQERADALNLKWQLEKKAKGQDKRQDKKKSSPAAIQVQIGGHKSKQSQSKQSQSKKQGQSFTSSGSASSERSAALKQVAAYESDAKRDLVGKLSARAKSEGLDLNDDLSKLSLQQLQKLDARWQDAQEKKLSFLDVLKTFFTLQGYATKQLGDATVDTAGDVYGLLVSIVNALGQIVEMLQLYAPALSDIIHDLGPALKQLNELVMEPYLGLVKDSKVTMQKFKEDAVAGRLDPDSITPPISGPWQDWKRVAAISTACSLPIAGAINRSELGVVSMARYQSLTGRGWPSDYEMLQWAAGQPGMLGPAMDMANMMPAGKIPAWFLKN